MVVKERSCFGGGSNGGYIYNGGERPCKQQSNNSSKHYPHVQYIVNNLDDIMKKN